MCDHHHQAELKEPIIFCLTSTTNREHSTKIISDDHKEDLARIEVVEFMVAARILYRLSMD